MPIEIISRRQRGTSVSHTRLFEYLDFEGSGLSVDCDENGSVDPSKMNAVVLARYTEATTKGTLEGRPVKDRGTQRFESNWTEPAVGKCPCGKHVTLSGFTNTCDCGRDFNMSGQQLADRSQWGEETGESVADILSVDSNSDGEGDADYNPYDV